MELRCTRNRALRNCLAVAVVTLSPLLSPAAQSNVGPRLYRFTEVAGYDDIFAFFDAPPSINSSGVVAFLAHLNIAHQLGLIVTEGIFTGTGGPPTMIVGDSTSGFHRFGQVPSINDAGTVAFVGFSGSVDGVFIGNGGPITTIAVASESARQAPRINEDGTVAFEMSVDFNTRSGIFTGSGGPVTSIVTADPGSLFNNFSDPSINNARTVVFTATLNDSSVRIMTGDRGTLATIADTHDGVFKALSAFPSINNLGNVIFAATLVDGSGAVVTSVGGTLATVVDTRTGFAWFGEGTDINDEGTVVFLAGLTGGGAGLFTGPDPIADKVIATGDLLSGSSVTDVTFVRGGLNNSGEIAFLAGLADQRRVIVRASPILAPSSKDDCKKGGWQRFVPLSFKNQGDCVSWVNKHEG